MTAAGRTLVAGFGGPAAVLMTVWTGIAAADETTPASPLIQKPVVPVQVAQAREPEIKDWNAIVRALAPGYHDTYGKPRLIDLDIQFAFDKTVLLPAAIRQLDHLATTSRVRGCKSVGDDEA